MRYCLHLIRSMVSTGDEAVLQDFTDQGAINQLISECCSCCCCCWPISEQNA